ncbi:DeoR/GlpR family DNA-binding transcription regulator [Brachyspira pilosicoli]|uniref:DeoR/GlpR family DNA-binding transcription regulator n=1 Tax=Brachyspira pilosicoli TaxID=52584 RepID=UPI003005619D
MRSKRIDDIKKFIYNNKIVTLDQICNEFKISKSTIRRDIQDLLLSDKRFKKIYGGIKFDSKNSPIPFNERKITNADNKILIAKRAAELVEDNDIIFIDFGTTVLNIVDYLKHINNLTVITNNLEVIYKSINYENMNIISFSGTLDRKNLSFLGASSANILKTFNISKCFMSTTGLSVTNGVTDLSVLESEIKSMAVIKSKMVVLLADKSKFNCISLQTYCNLNEIHKLITDELPPDDISSYLKENNIDILIAK